MKSLPKLLYRPLQTMFQCMDERNNNWELGEPSTIGVHFSMQVIKCYCTLTVVLHARSLLGGKKGLVTSKSQVPDT